LQRQIGGGVLRGTVQLLVVHETAPSKDERAGSLPARP
jgi:hypothetical protein